ncbi:MAG: uncharacterized protein JWN44_1201 [Myxococcales bacterium]|nr:uncharacterized protein [Myxococcales bacterium]
MGDAGAIVGVGILVLAWVGVSLVMPIVAWTAARRARRDVELLRLEVTELRREAAGVPAPPRGFAPRAAAPIVVEPPPASAVEPPPASAVEPHAIVVEDATATTSTTTAPSMPAAAPTPAAAPSSTLEEKIALVWFTRIGAAILLLGVAWFFKYAVDSNWIGPLGRVALGALAGAGILVAAEALRPRTRATYIQVLAGVGLAALFLTAYAAHAFYHLIPSPAAFAAVAVVTLLGGALAIHHRGEAILVLSLIAGLASPVLLSTGEDRPAALFGYLFVLTAFVFWAALRMSFRWAAWLAIVGPPVLFAGWYGRFFDVSPPPAEAYADVPPEALTGGAYFVLAHRAAPLLAVAAFFAEWVAVYTVARRRALTRLWPLAILCAAALAAHAGFAALLYDRTVVLGAVLTALAFASSLLFGRENRRELLLLPLGASFIVLVVTLHGSARGDVVGVMALLALWGAVYARAFLQDQLAAGSAPSPGRLWATGAVGLAVAVAAGVLLLEHHRGTFGVALAALSLAFALLAVVSGRPLVAALAVGLSLPGLGLVAAVGSHHEHRLIGIFAAWAAIYLASVAWDVLRKGAALTPARIIIFSAAGLGFALLAESETQDSEWLLRAGLLAAVGAVDLAFGATLVARARGGATVLLGQALALFAGAVAFCFSGATLTLVWAAMAAVVAVLAATEEDRAWLAGAALLFGVALCHLAAVDLEAADRARELFFWTRGHEGQLRLALFFNPRTYALVGTAVALLVAARAAARRRPRPLFEWAAAAFLVVAHALLVTVCVFEVQSALLTTPTLPRGLDEAEFSAFTAEFAGALAAAGQTLRMTTTLVFAVYASLLVAVGFFARDRVHRYLGLALFALTLGKLALYDIWTLPRVFQMLVLLAVGALLLGASFLYARFGKRLVALIRDGNVEKVAVVVFALLVGSRADAFDASKLEFQRPVEGINAPGLYRIEVDPELYRHSKSDNLSDIRIATVEGAEIPWLVRRMRAPEQPVEHPVTLVDPVQLPDGAVRAVLDLGAPGLKHSEVRLDVAGEGDWFRKTRVEVSTDEATWALLTEGAYVFRVTTAGTSAQSTTLSYPVSDARYLRVTLLPAAGAPVRITGASVAWVPPESHVPLRLLPMLKPLPQPLPGDAKATIWTIDLGAAGVPIHEVAVDIGDAAFERRALLAAANHQTYWAPVGATLLFRVPASGKQAQENVRLPAGETRKRYLRLTVYNGDDSPPDVRGLSPAYAAEEIVFRAPANASYMLYVGGDLPAPTYDLAAVMARSGEEPNRTATMGTISPNPTFGHLTTPAAPQPWSERFKLPIGIALTALLALLALWTLRLLRRAR